MAKYNIPNLYIANRDRANAGGGSDPTLEARVEALETSVDGAGGLTDQVDTLDEQINGDSTATPPVPGIVDEIEALELEVFGDSTTTPPVAGLEDRVTALENAPASGVNYSTTERLVGKWIDNRDLYEKTIELGNLPSATTKNVAHGISNLSNIVYYSGSCYEGTSFMPLPKVNTANYSYSIEIYADTTNITIRTGENFSGWTGYLTIRYTKTS